MASGWAPVFGSQGWGCSWTVVPGLPHPPSTQGQEGLAWPCHLPLLGNLPRQITWAGLMESNASFKKRFSIPEGSSATLRLAARLEGPQGWDLGPRGLAAATVSAGKDTEPLSCGHRNSILLAARESTERPSHGYTESPPCADTVRRQMVVFQATVPVVVCYTEEYN